MISINQNIPTSTLLDVKVGDEVDNGAGKAGEVSKINITETDEYLQFLFGLNNGQEIEIRKLKQIC
ncbi:hypothetical protein DHW03_02630 [Pedobacter yonginense]|uniref:Uncharacterized protein n=1 Tax=Pedobacter yonginense TaxID=651869 RepID=A0A317EU41_9SPHI|nr:hypothetical protein [Pedobacter yonginense]PWS28756.1 hypothetical protein DHW03_02630 [Pedobacter yonginense]